MRGISLEVSCHLHVVRETATQRHVLLLVDEQRVGLDLDVVLEPFLVLEQILQGLVGLLQLVLEVLDAGVQLVHLLDELVVRLVVAGLHVGAAGPLLQPRLGHAQRRVLGRNVGLEAFQVALLLGDFLKFGIRIKCAPPPTSSIGSNGKVINNTRFHLLPLICTNLIKKEVLFDAFHVKVKGNMRKYIYSLFC